MIENIPEELRAKLKGKEKDLEKAILELREYAKMDLGETDSHTPLRRNTLLYDKIPELIKYVRMAKTAVAQASIMCRPEKYIVDRDEWFKPFEEVNQALDYAEYLIITKLREHE